MRHIARFAAALLVLASCGTSHTTAGSLTSATTGGDVAGRDLREQTADEQVKQALNRLAFGARPGDAERVRDMGVDRWIATQLSPASIDDRATEQFVSRFPMLAMSPERPTELPTMLYYLDNWESTVEPGRLALVSRARRGKSRGLNENYGRELLELHTLGVDGGYTQADVVNVARAFTGWTIEKPRGDIRECLRMIFTSQEFFSRSAYKAKVKSPFELVVSALRVVGAQPDGTPRTAQMVAKLGEPLYGHLAPNGYPERGDAWINTGAILQRINFGLAVAAGRVPGASLATWPDGRALAAQPTEAQVDGVIRTILAGEASPDTRKVLELGVNPMAGDSAAANAKSGGFANIVGLALGAPEFQRR